MGLLDDAIREHLELKRKHGAPEEELQRQEEEALGPARRDVAPGQTQETNGAGEPAAGEAPEEEPRAGEPKDAELPSFAFGEGPAKAAPAEPQETAATEHGTAVEEPELQGDAAGPSDRDMPASDAALFDHEVQPASAERAPAASESEPAAAQYDEEPRAVERSDEPAAAEHHDEAAAVEALEPEGDAPSEGFDALEEELLGDAEEVEEPPAADQDVLEDTPDFLQETPEHDRLWFEQKPPRDFDFD